MRTSCFRRFRRFLCMLRHSCSDCDALIRACIPASAAPRICSASGVPTSHVPTPLPFLFPASTSDPWFVYSIRKPPKPDSLDAVLPSLRPGSRSSLLGSEHSWHSAYILLRVCLPPASIWHTHFSSAHCEQDVHVKFRHEYLPRNMRSAAMLEGSKGRRMRQRRRRNLTRPHEPVVWASPARDTGDVP